MINEFIKTFTDKKIENVRKIGKRYFLISSDVEESISSNKITVESAGIFLGEEKKEHFRPSLALLEIISKDSSRKIFVDEKSEWLFLCGRDIMAGSILKTNVDSGLVLIQNEKDENLGYGKIIDNLRNNPNRIVIKNLIDKGDYLRREMG